MEAQACLAYFCDSTCGSESRQREGFGVKGIMCLRSGCNNLSVLCHIIHSTSNQQYMHHHILIYIYMVYGYISPITLFISPLSLSHIHIHIQFCDAVLHLNVANSSLSVPRDKKRKGKTGYVDKLFPTAAKDSSEQVDLGDGSFCNSEHHFFPIVIKTTQPIVFIPSNHSNIIARFIFWGKSSEYHIISLLRIFP